jgi:hypothetical protein
VGRREGGEEAGEEEGVAVLTLRWVLEGGKEERRGEDGGR